MLYPWLLYSLANVRAMCLKDQSKKINVITSILETIQALHPSSTPRAILGWGDLRPTFRNTCANLCEIIKKVRKCPFFFHLILSFYP